jgi:hypothetical protein
VEKGINQCYQERVYGEEAQAAVGEILPLTVIKGPCLVYVKDSVRVYHRAHKPDVTPDGCGK